jgi:hypothetical protein
MKKEEGDVFLDTTFLFSFFFMNFALLLFRKVFIFNTPIQSYIICLILMKLVWIGLWFIV